MKIKLSKWILPLLWGWFFAVQTPGNVPGTVAVTAIGPFKDEQACKSDLEEMKAFLESFGVQYKVVANCVYRTES